MINLSSKEEYEALLAEKARENQAITQSYENIMSWLQKNYPFIKEAYIKETTTVAMKKLEESLK